MYVYTAYAYLSWFTFLCLYLLGNYEHSWIISSDVAIGIVSVWLLRNVTFFWIMKDCLYSSILRTQCGGLVRVKHTLLVVY